MKIAILTQPLFHNYGGLLQNYALQQVLKQCGHEPETIDWKRPKLPYVRLIISEVKTYLFHFLFPAKYKKLQYVPSEQEQKIIRRNTDAFIKKYINKTPTVQTKDGFVLQANKSFYEAYVVGSDQCWRPSYNSFLPEMYLSFLKSDKIKRIAYGVSFGTDKWEYTLQQTKCCSELIKHFDVVSVRENSGVDLCKKYLGIDATVVLDPTLLLKKEDYIEIVKQINLKNSDGKLFYYILDPTPNKQSIVNNLAKCTSLKPFTVLPKCQAEVRTKEDVKKNIDDCIYPEVEKWLKAYEDAEMTIVDSYHGMVFSIIYNKPFWVIGNKERGETRFTSLLELLNLKDRLVYEEDSLEIKYDKEIDWGSVNKTIEELRKFSISILSDSL